MDGDVFGKVGRLGRHAADALHRALTGGRWEPFHASKCLDAVIARAGGVPLLAVVRGELQTLRALPLLARTSVEGAIQRIRDAALGPECTRLDLILRGVTERALLGGEFRMRPVLEHFCGEVLDGAVVTGRGGFLEQHGSGQLDGARSLLVPIAGAGADVLEQRPHAKRLDLARSFRVTADTDLLGGA